MRFDPNELLWEQKYRPQTIADCVLPKALRESFEEMVKAKSIKNLLLVSSTPGTGKTTVARALCNELGADMLFINASEESGIDVFRHQIRQFASTMSLVAAPKVVVLDEADNLSQNAQAAFRGMIEEFSRSCRFILTCNQQNRIIEPIQSRLSIHTFVTPAEEVMDVMKLQLKRCLSILANENIVVEDNKIVWELVKREYPDNRALMVALQHYASKGMIDTGVLAALNVSGDIETFIGYLQNRSFREIREMIPTAAMDYTTFIRQLYDALYRKVAPSHIPLMIEIIGENQKYYRDVPDLEIHLAYLSVLLMTQMVWVNG